MSNSLQKQLTRSHFLVTLISIMLLTLLVFLGYYIYLQSRHPAQWAGLEASEHAEEIAYLLTVLDVPLSEEVAHEYLYEFLDLGIYGDEIGVWAADDADVVGMLILSVQGQILASDNPTAYPVGEMIETISPPVFHPGWLDTDGLIADELETLNYYGQQDDFHVGFAPILNPYSKLLGWFYYRGYDKPTSTIITQIALQLAIILLGAMLIALAGAMFMGRQISQRFAQRLQHITVTSAALADGHLDQRVVIDDNPDDELVYLATQFNRMADQIGTQMHELRQLADTNAQLAQESRGLAALEERNRLARDLHDAIKQKLFGLNLTAGALKLLVQSQPDQAIERLDNLSQMTTEIIEEMDQIIQQLRPAALEDQGLVDALTGLINNWQSQTGIEVTFASQRQRELALNVEHTLYRVVQEALTNILKHAAAQRVTIDLIYGVNEVQLTISDDGQGFDVEQPRNITSLGLDSMATRVDDVDGIFSITSIPDNGTQLQIQIPDIALEKMTDG